MKPPAVDIHGALLFVGDVVRITPERYHRFKGTGKPGEMLRLVRIYEDPLGENIYVGELQYLDGTGSIWNSQLNLYEKVHDEKDIR